MKIDEVTNQRAWLFDEIRNETLEDRIINVLRMPYPKLNNRLYVSYTFRGCKISIDKAMEYFDKYCQWEGYNHDLTKHILTGIYNIKPKDKCISFDKSVHPLSSTFKDIESAFLLSLPLRPMDVPNDNKTAAYFYWDNGFIPLPKKDGKKHPYIKYSHFRETGYPRQYIENLDWSHGVCLLGTKTRCFLDVDAKGVEAFNREILYGRHYERTPSGGYHVYGIGNLKSNNALSGIIELKGNTNLIVAFPTDRYKITKWV